MGPLLQAGTPHPVPGSPSQIQGAPHWDPQPHISLVVHTGGDVVGAIAGAGRGAGLGAATLSRALPKGLQEPGCG